MMFAGPNGSGKSTVTRYLQQQPNFPANYANADEVAQTLTGDPMLQSYEAARMVGGVTQLHPHYVVQNCDGTFVLHDRLLLQGDYQIGQSTAILYREGVGRSSI
jgi:ABC-type cobalamin/Fe3+-siderophores transport system ATPase subunit